MTSRRIANAAAPRDNAGVRIVLVAVVLAACGNPAGDAKTGAEVFTKVCTPCHGPTGKPDATMVAKLGVKDLTSPEFRAQGHRRTWSRTRSATARRTS